MPFDRPTLTELVNRIEDDFKTRIDGATSLLRRSLLSVLARVYAGAAHLMYAFIEYSAKQLYASQADSEGLDRLGSEYNLTRTAAVKATGITVATGTNGVNIPAGTELQSDSEEVYVTDAAIVIAGGTASLAVTAKIAGADANDNGSITLTFVSPITGVDSDTTVDADGISGGTDAESDAALRARILTRRRLPPHGGAQHDYEAWALEVAGVTRVWVFPLVSGPGTVGLAFVRDAETPIFPDAAERQAVRDYIVEHTDPASGTTVGIPLTAEPGFSIIELVEVQVNITINLSPNTAAVQAAVTSELESFLEREAGPGNTLYLSQFSEAISLATGEVAHTLVSPAADLVAQNDQLHTLGVITFNEYS